MTTRVRDIMNPQLLYMLADEPATSVRTKMLHFGISGMPVLDRANRPIGFVSLRDFAIDGTTFHITSPVVTVRETIPVTEAARTLAEGNVRRLVVVDEHGVAIGMVSAIDLVRALAGVPPRHPAHFDTPCTSADAFPDDVRS